MVLLGTLTVSLKETEGIIVVIIQDSILEPLPPTHPSKHLTCHILSIKRGKVKVLNPAPDPQC